MEFPSNSSISHVHAWMRQDEPNECFICALWKVGSLFARSIEWGSIKTNGEHILFEVPTQNVKRLFCISLFGKWPNSVCLASPLQYVHIYKAWNTFAQRKATHRTKQPHHTDVLVCTANLPRQNSLSLLHVLCDQSQQMLVHQSEHWLRGTSFVRSMYRIFEQHVLVNALC